MNPKVDGYLERNSRWQPELTELRRIVGQTTLTEDLKWGVPCYTEQNANVVLLHVFKEYCAILFVKGSLLGDPARVLITQTENVQAGRQLRFTNVDEILAKESLLKAYLAEAIDLEKSGAKVEFKPTKEFAVPEEFQAELEGDPDLKAAFEGLTPGRQRGYLLFFAGAKQSKTREARIEKCRPAIMEGKGLDD
jgi:uncharacterized protein YdeI (YjbR/CyaY-like superfamily)